MLEKDFSRDVKLAIFKGKSEDWKMWSAKFISFATFKEFDGVLLGREEVPNEENDSNYKRMKN